jgi:integrase
MPRLRLRHPNLPPSLVGWTVVNDAHQPCFWATVWADWILADVGHGTRGRHLLAVERLYQAVVKQSGTDRLDDIIAEADFEALEAALGGFLAKLRNESAISGKAREQTWQSALRFVDDVMTHVGRASGSRISDINAKLLRHKRLYSQISPTPPKAAPPLRALPAVVIEELYALFNPESARNPFKTEALRWRNYLIFLILLHLGLRRGEALILPADAIHDDIDPQTGEVTLWVNIDETPYEDEDPRFLAPSLKTVHSRRQIPVSEEIARLTDVYTQNYRGRPLHAFLFNSQKSLPLAPQSLGDVFTTITAKLSDRSNKALQKNGKESVSSHDLRHTAAVHRLARYRAAGYDLDEAIEKLRGFFGWSRTSEMPRHYARAYFETSLDDVWNENFDSFVETLRGISGEPR